jgi:exopolysaccharide biosynthesis polyprenyl glycosylphosphotransferase
MTEIIGSISALGARGLRPHRLSPRRASRSAEARPTDTTTAADALEVDSSSRALPTWGRRFQRALLVSDSAIVSIAIVVSLVTRFGLSPAQVEIGGVIVHHFVVGAIIGIAWLVMLAAFRTRTIRTLGVGFAEYKGIVSSSLFTFGILAIAFLVFQVDVARGFFMVALPVGLFTLLLDRWLWRRWLNHMRSAGNYLARAIVVGDPSDVDYVVRQIDKKSGAAYKVIGLAIPQGAGLRVAFAEDPVPVIAHLGNVGQAVRATNADTVIVAGEPRDRANFIRDLGWELEGLGADLVIASSLTNVAGPRIHFRPVEGLPLMHVELPNYDGGKHVLKRLLDVTLASLALLVLIPVFLVVAAAIRRDSAGPVLFRQERVGRNGATFRMLKFRSMVSTAEADLADLLDQNQGSGLLFKMKNDPRITRVGRILRRYSIDELPQFWNVLVGDMSLVGPRPPLQTEVQGYERHVHRRLYIKPGLTGMWQVNGRSDLSWEESVRLDLYYVENWSLTGDLIILWRTFRVLVAPLGAY